MGNLRKAQAKWPKPRGEPRLPDGAQGPGRMPCISPDYLALSTWRSPRDSRAVSPDLRLHPTRLGAGCREPVPQPFCLCTAQRPLSRPRSGPRRLGESLSAARTGTSEVAPTGAGHGLRGRGSPGERLGLLGARGPSHVTRPPPLPPHPPRRAGGGGAGAMLAPRA